jgi:branched-chain amino acid aminotransferase
MARRQWSACGASRVEGAAMRAVERGEFEGGSVFIEGDWKPLSEAKVSMFDWGFTRSDVTYDVATAWHGAFFRLDDHLDRFFNSLEKMRMTIPYSRAEVRQILHACVKAGGLEDAYVAMVCTRGVPPRGARDPRLAVNRFYAYALPFVWIAPPEKQAQGIDLHVSRRIRIAPESVDPTVKNYHWIDLVMSMFDAYDRGADTSCVVDAQGNVAEGPGFNVFMVENGVVRTPDRGVLEGISRKTVIELCSTLGIPLRVEPVPAVELAGADEVFISSSGGGVLPIARIDGQPLGDFPGPITKRLRDAYWALHDDPRYRDPVER